MRIFGKFMYAQVPQIQFFRLIFPIIELWKNKDNKTLLIKMDSKITLQKFSKLKNKFQQYFYK